MYEFVKKKVSINIYFCLLKEPIGWFIHCCQLVVGKGQEIYDGDDDKDEEAPSLDKMIDFCDDLVRLSAFSFNTLIYYY